MHALLALFLLLLVGCGSGHSIVESPPLPRARTAAPQTDGAFAAMTPPLLLAVPGTAGAGANEQAPRDVRLPTGWRGEWRWSGGERIAHARNVKEAEVRALFRAAGVAYPPEETLLRVFKQERELELWAGDGAGALRLVATYGICAASGGLGPKRREGDQQVPEGFYKIGYYDPTSAFHLAMQIDYPNASDRARGGPQPGGEILIHGKCASIGCVAMSDERIDEIFLVGWSAFMRRKPVVVHMFPGRDFDALIAMPEHAEHHDFWREIRRGFDAFEATHRLPVIRTEPDGRYDIEEN